MNSRFNSPRANTVIAKNGGRPSTEPGVTVVKPYCPSVSVAARPNPVNPAEPSRRSAPLPKVVSSTPLSAMVPAVGSTSRLMQRISVDLPAPDGPISATTSPCATSRSILSSARSPVR